MLRSMDVWTIRVAVMNDLQRGERRCGHGKFVGTRCLTSEVHSSCSVAVSSDCPPTFQPAPHDNNITPIINTTIHSIRVENVFYLLNIFFTKKRVFNFSYFVKSFLYSLWQLNIYVIWEVFLAKLWKVKCTEWSIHAKTYLSTHICNIGRFFALIIQLQY